MTLEKRPAKCIKSISLLSPKQRALVARSAAAFFVTLFVFASNHAKTMPISDTDASVVAAAPSKGQADDGPSIRRFTVNVPQAKIDDLRRRITATQSPEKETVADQSQGVPLATMRELARYWATDYDWRKAEAKLNAFPQFVTNIYGLDIHFIHVKSREKNALPLIINHGWPGS